MMKRLTGVCSKRRLNVALAFVIAALTMLDAAAAPVRQERMVEWSFESHKIYKDPFNDVDVDVVFSKEEQSWTVPAFWRGGSRWTVRFAPPVPGDYHYRLQSTDSRNPDLNGQEGNVTVSAYTGPNELLRHGMLRVSANKRYFEHADGTPFYWLGDTWWESLSDRVDWNGFQKLVADRQAKGFTVVQIVAGLVPPEEVSPIDPGARNEGGPVWDSQFKQINPQYFDYADRRLQRLIDHGMVPALAGAWDLVLAQMGVKKMKQHWRYLIARYGAYPVFWIVGGQVLDPPEAQARQFPDFVQSVVVPGWTEVVKYVREIDPYHHPLTVHENPPPYDTALRDETLTDFDLFQSSHFGWPSLAVEVAQINQHYARTQMTKPVVQGEIGYEKLGESHFENFQRTAFWLSMLNGAAGHTYGANGVFEAYTANKPLHRLRWSLMSWEEGMNLPGSYQVGLGAKLLRQYPWWRLEPHPEWVNPRGTTLLEPQSLINGFAYDKMGPDESFQEGNPLAQQEATPVASDWKAKHGTFLNPYAAGIRGQLRIIYLPSMGASFPTPPTVAGLEPGVGYRAYWWEPSTGTRFDLGAIGRPAESATLFSSAEALNRKTASEIEEGDESLLLLRRHRQANVVANVRASSAAMAGLVLRFQDKDNYIAAVYSPDEKSLSLLDRRNGTNGPPLGTTTLPRLGPQIKISAEVRDSQAVASISDGENTYSTPIVDLNGKTVGTAGVLEQRQGPPQHYSNFRLLDSPLLVKDKDLCRKLFDAKGEYRGELEGADMFIGDSRVAGWSEFARRKAILLDAYRPDKLPMAGDWVLVLDAMPGAHARACSGSSSSL